MSITKVAANNNTFEWKLNMSMNNASDSTEDVSIDGYNVRVIVDYFRYNSPAKRLCQFRLHTDCNSIFPVSYALSILDHHGHAFVSTKGKVLGDVAEAQLPMMFDVSYLRACNVVEGDILTVRFTLLTPRSQLYSDHRTHPTEGDFANSLETLSKDFSTFYESKMDTDCVLKVSDEQFRVHRSILSARSRVFSAMFPHDIPERHSVEVDIPDVEATVLSNVLFYIYSGKVQGLTVDTAASMYTVAGKYDLFELRTQCLDFLKHNLTLGNFSKVALLADAHEEVVLQLQVALFIKENFNEVVKSTAWQQLTMNNAAITTKLLMSALEAFVNKRNNTI